MQHYWSYFSWNCYSITGIGEFAGAYFKHWSLQYILEPFFKRHRQHVKTPDVSSMLSASLSWVGKESVSQTPLGKWSLDWNSSHCFAMHNPRKKGISLWGKEIGNPKIPEGGKLSWRKREEWKARWSLLLTSNPPGLEVPLDFFISPQTLGGGGVILVLQMWKLRLREAARLWND